MVWIICSNCVLVIVDHRDIPSYSMKFFTNNAIACFSWSCALLVLHITTRSNYSLITTMALIGVVLF